MNPRIIRSIIMTSVHIRHKTPTNNQMEYLDARHDFHNRRNHRILLMVVVANGHAFKNQHDSRETGGQEGRCFFKFRAFGDTCIDKNRNGAEEEDEGYNGSHDILSVAWLVLNRWAL